LRAAGWSPAEVVARARALSNRESKIEIQESR
jgi:hypothetical protein